MQISTSTAEPLAKIALRPWRDDLLTAIIRSHIIAIEPVSWLSARQAPRVNGLIKDIRVFQALAATKPANGNTVRAQRRQARQIAARLIELQQVGVRVCWASTGHRNLRIICQRARR